MSDKGTRTRGIAERHSSHGAGRLSVSERCELLADSRRRALLQYMVRRPGESVSVDDLADHLAVCESADDRRTVLVSLHHVHLPRLAEAGVISYDPDRRVLEYAPHEGLEGLLALLEEH